MPMSINKEATAKYTGKANVFHDLFQIIRYTTELANALHPKENFTPTEIELTTIEPTLLNEPYNDLGILARDRLLILVEAQSTWSLNVLIRLFLYAASTMQNFIKSRYEKPLNVYSKTKIKLPQPEFFLIYTESR